MAHELIARTLDRLPQCVGQPQQSGPLTVLPLFGKDHGGRFTPPLSGLKLGGVVRGYGNVELHNPSPDGIVILPLHMGYIQDKAQNHALCGSALLGAGQKRLFQDACCVQAGQGGYLAEKEQWFFILPLQLRAQALELRGKNGYSKLWDAIAKLNAQLGKASRGHLEEIVCHDRPYLTQYQSRFELLSGQTGAMFFLGDRLVGVELAPNAAYFQDVWFPLVCFCYGAAALEFQKPDAPKPTPKPFRARSLSGLRRSLNELRQSRRERVQTWLAETPAERFSRHEEERYLDLKLTTALGKDFAGQYVEDGDELVYLSLAARPEYLRGAKWEPGVN